ncbi:hypothetical protein, partial [Methanoregula sp.]|uniref:hypothetical protein n=1 Tax=Methanoregula sp. TaxID=2052170 RepID=UPI000CB0B9FF
MHQEPEGDDVTELSPGAILAWEIAAVEAGHSGAEFIEKEHFLIGLCSIGKLVSRKTGNPHDDRIENIAREGMEIDQLLQITGQDATVIRRLMRIELGTGSSSPTSRIIHRSPECKKYFSRAAWHA